MYRRRQAGQTRPMRRLLLYHRHCEQKGKMRGGGDQNSHGCHIENGGRTRAVSSGRTVQSICRISRWANSAQRGSSNPAGCENEESIKARMFRTRGPFPGSWMMGLERRMSIGSSAGPYVAGGDMGGEGVSWYG